MKSEIINNVNTINLKVQELIKEKNIISILDSFIKLIKLIKNINLK